MNLTPAPPQLVAAWAEEDALRDWERDAAEQLSRAEAETSGWGCEHDHPSLSDVELLEAMLSRPAHLLDMLLLAEVEVGALPSKLLGLAVSRRLDELAAMLAARQSEVVVGLAGVEPSGEYLAERHVEMEIAQGRTVSETTAGLDVELARSLHSTFPAFRTALAAGRIREGHCRRIVQATRLTMDAEALALIAKKALPLAERLTPAQFAFQVRKLVATYDPDAEGRRTRATSERDVWWEKLDDGQGRLVYTDEWHKVNALGIRIRRAGAGHPGRAQGGRRGRPCGPGRGGRGVEPPQPVQGRAQGRFGGGGLRPGWHPRRGAGLGGRLPRRCAARPGARRRAGRRQRRPRPRRTGERRVPGRDRPRDPARRG
jgi:hypothetical protein